MRAVPCARLLPLAVALILLASCARLAPDADLAIGSGSPATAALLGVSAGPAMRQLRLQEDDASAALASYRESCRAIGGREDISGLTRPADWHRSCEEAGSGPADQPASFFARHFTPVRVGDGAAFATGYFEPEILASRTRRPGYETPVYAMPPDLVRGRSAAMPESDRTGRAPLGRYDAQGRFLPYFTRAQIEDGALAGRGLELAWAADPVELFFLQIQGSGRLRTPEGEIIPIGYAGQNGHAYTGIGAILRERGLLGDAPGQYPASMQGIMAYIRENPEDGAALMRRNASWVFFRELGGDGPLGALGIPVRGKSSVAVDPRYVPYGAPVWLDLDREEADGLWIAQDTGGAIKGANRFDTFWGAGEDARRIAGDMRGRGAALVLLPNPAARRLGL